MHPVQNAVYIGAQGWHRSSRQHEQIARAPGALHGMTQVRTLALHPALALEHKEQGAAGPGRGRQAVARLKTQEASRQSWAGGWRRAAQLGAGVEWQDRRRTGAMEGRPPLAIANGFGESLAHRIGGFAVVEEARLVLQGPKAIGGIPGRNRSAPLGGVAGIR